MYVVLLPSGFSSLTGVGGTIFPVQCASNTARKYIVSKKIPKATANAGDAETSTKPYGNDWDGYVRYNGIWQKTSDIKFRADVLDKEASGLRVAKEVSDQANRRLRHII